MKTVLFITEYFLNTGGGVEKRCFQYAASWEKKDIELLLPLFFHHQKEKFFGEG